MLETAKAECQRLCAAVTARYDGEIKRAEERFVAVMADSDATPPAGASAGRRLASPPPGGDDRAAGRRAGRGRRRPFPPHSALQRQLDDEAQAVRRRFEETIADNQRQYERQWAELTDRWTNGLARLRAAIEDIRDRSAGLFPAWDADAWGNWTPPTEIPPAIRFGAGRGELGEIDGGLPADPRLAPPQTEFTLPLLLPFPHHSLLLLKAAREGRAKAVDASRPSCSAC